MNFNRPAAGKHFAELFQHDLNTNKPVAGTILKLDDFVAIIINWRRHFIFPILLHVLLTFPISS